MKLLKSFRKSVFYVVVAIVLLMLSAFVFKKRKVENSPKYIFYFIGDGMGLNHLTATQDYIKQKELNNNKLLFLDFPVKTKISTLSENNSVTCSAAAATALACGVKTKNGVLGMSSDFKVKYKSILYDAKEKGMKTGVITSVTIDHATPAGFYANCENRDDYSNIAKQLINTDFDFFAGGGFTSSLPIDSIDKQSQEISLYNLAENNKFKVIRSIDEFNKLKQGDYPKVIAVTDYITQTKVLPLRIDRGEQSFSLSDFLKKGIDFLKNDKGFFIMIEGGQIDWTSHSNDLSSAVGEIIDFNDAVGVAIEFYKKHPEETLIIVTSDHETGGLSPSIDKGNIKVLDSQKKSYFLSEYECKSYFERGLVFDSVFTKISKYFAFNSDITLSNNDTLRLINAYEAFMGKEFAEKKILYTKYNPILIEATAILCEKAGYYWKTTDHTGENVGLFVIGKKSEIFKDNTDNTEIVKDLRSFLNTN